MTRISCVACAIMVMSAMLGVVGCAKRTFYSNVFGQYTLSQAHKQYARLFQMEPRVHEKFLTFENGWWKADVRKMRQMRIEIVDLYQRYCRTASIRVPFPVLIDYELLHGGG